MGPINLGPDWFWKLMAVCAVIGLVGTIAFVIKSIVWLVNHIHIY
jgi:hypothetical protein